MITPLLEVGFGNYIFSSQVLVILNPNSQPTKRIIHEAKKNNKLIDIKQGKKTGAVIVLKNKNIVVSPISSKTIKMRYDKNIININKKTEKNSLETFLEIGFDNYVLPKNISIILNPKSQPTIRTIQNAKNNNTCFDVRHGKKTRSAIALVSGEIIISTIDAKTLKKRYLDSMNRLLLERAEDNE